MPGAFLSMYFQHETEKIVMANDTKHLERIAAAVVNQALSVTLESCSNEITPLSVAKAPCFILWSLSTCSGSFPWRSPARSSSLCRRGNTSSPSCPCWWPQCTVLWVSVTPSCACTAACWVETRSPNSIDVHECLAVLLLFMEKKEKKLLKRLWKWVIWSSLLPHTARWDTARLALWQHLCKNIQLTSCERNFLGLKGCECVGMSVYLGNIEYFFILLNRKTVMLNKMKPWQNPQPTGSLQDEVKLLENNLKR